MADLSPLANGSAIESAAARAGLPLWIAAALAEVESGGRNIYGHDSGGTMYGRGEVTRQNFTSEFLPAVLNGAKSNGVGPVQITYPGYFRQNPSLAWWDPRVSCEFGFRILAGYLRGDYSGGSIARAGSRYNSGTETGSLSTYGAKLRAAANRWLERLGDGTKVGQVATPTGSSAVAFNPNSAVTDVTLSPNYSSGRPSGSPNVIVIHHWGVDGQSHQNVVNYLCRSGGNSSAHYVASNGRVTQLVSDWNRAWHAGSSGNPRGIGIECRPEMSDGDFATVAALVKAIRAEHGDLPLRGHQNYMSTACPGRWQARLAALDAAARSSSGRVTATGTSAAASLQARSGFDAKGGLIVDGVWGAATTLALQVILGMQVQDGVLSSQSAAHHSSGVLKAVSTASWEFVRAPQGSQTVAALQRHLRVEDDGIFGPDSVAAACGYFRVARRKVLDETLVKAIQTRLRGGKLGG